MVLEFLLLCILKRNNDIFNPTTFYFHNFSFLLIGQEASSPHWYILVTAPSFCGKSTNSYVYAFSARVNGKVMKLFAGEKDFKGSSSFPVFCLFGGLEGPTPKLKFLLEKA
ncbi:hypothetical protein AVEN_269306-1 [Araneus ventricosus]|uniref:Uncharacterized protein n=1 Tax=Araneus ventricosus TaxID=182803 RepID=A0A4Y2I2P4_ARAVE|nr:hypothetical protein AVEN_269306-1 [Araneus ventricosus]